MEKLLMVNIKILQKNLTHFNQRKDIKRFLLVSEFDCFDSGVYYNSKKFVSYGDDIISLRCKINEEEVKEAEKIFKIEALNDECKALLRSYDEALKEINKIKKTLKKEVGNGF